MRFLALVSVLFLTLNANAQDTPRYEAWQSSADGVQTMSDELRRLVDEAARARAADPRFLDDLRALADRYGNPWPVALIREDFRDGDFTFDPAWTIASGEFAMDRTGGLFSNVVAPVASAPPPAQPEPERKVRGEDIARQLLGQLLNPDRQSAQPAPPQQQPAASLHATPAEAYLVQPVSNAFSLTARLAMDAGAGPLTIGFFQGQARRTGYFLEYDPITGLTLLRRGASGGVAMGSGLASLADGADHTVTWTRAGNGEMVVTVDETEALRVTDTGFRDDWSGVVLVNGGGAATLRTLNVFGAH